MLGDVYRYDRGIVSGNKRNLRGNINMEGIKTFLTAVMAVSVSAGVIKLLSPSEKLKKEIGFAIAAVSLFSLITPLVSIFEEGTPRFELSVPSFESVSQDNAEEGIVSAAAEIICRELEYAVEKKYGIEAPSVSVVLNTENISKIEIVSAEISGRGELSSAAHYISELLGCPVTEKEEE